MYARRSGIGAVDVNDFAAILPAIGLQTWTPDLFGFTSWSDAIRWVNAGNGTTALASGGRGFVSPSGAPVPELVALVQLLNAFRQTPGGYLPTASQALAMLGIAGASTPRPASLQVSAADWSSYRDSAIALAGPLAQLFDAAAPGEVAPTPAQVVQQSAAQQWNTALAAGAFTVPAGPAAGFKVPTSLITAGPVTLPDGIVYLAYHDPRPGGSGQFDPAVIWWNGPTYKPATFSGPMVKTANNQLVQLKDRGTGDWYRCMIVYGDDQTCRPPLSYTGAYTLPPEIARTLSNQGGQSATGIPPVVPATSAPTTAPGTMRAPATPPPVLYQAPTPQAPSLYQAPPVMTAVPGTTAPSTTPPPMYTPVTTVPAPSTPQPAPLPPSLYQSPGVVGGDSTPTAAAAAPSPTPATDWLLPALLVIGVGGVVLGDRARAKRRRRK